MYLATNEYFYQLYEKAYSDGTRELQQNTKIRKNDPDKQRKKFVPSRYYGKKAATNKYFDHLYKSA